MFIISGSWRVKKKYLAQVIGNREISTTGNRSPFVVRPSLFAVRRPPSAVRRPPSAVRRPSSAVRRPSSVLRPPSSVLRPPSSVLRPPSSVLRSLKFVYTLSTLHLFIYLFIQAFIGLAVLLLSFGSPG